MQPTGVCSAKSEPSSIDAHGSDISELNEATCLLEGKDVKMPLDIVMSLLRQDELAKLQKYVALYLGKHWQP